MFFIYKIIHVDDETVPYDKMSNRKGKGVVRREAGADNRKGEGEGGMAWRRVVTWGVPPQMKRVIEW